MMDFFKSIFCNHNYEFIQDTNHYRFQDDEYPYKKTKVFICTKCLKVKKVKIS